MKLNHRPEIDGLRAIAVVPVILFHAGLGLFSGGFVGVDVFFVISGYLITSIIVKEVAAGRFSLVDFYERRARRILPALFLVMAATIPFAWLWMFPLKLKEFAASIVSVCLFASNLLFWRQSGYFDSASVEKPLLHTWSLAVEEQYYIFFPLAVLLLWPLGRRRMLWAFGLTALASLGLSEWAWRHMPEANFYLLPTRAWELLAGALCSFARPALRPGRDNLLSLAGMAAILSAIFWFDETTPFPSLWALLPVLGSALVLTFARQGTLAARVLGARLPAGIGLISYSAYLWHQPLLAFAHIRSSTEPGTGLMLGACLLALILAWFSWRFVELPFRQKDHPLLHHRGMVFTLLGAMSVVFLAFGTGGYLTKGYPGLREFGGMTSYIASVENSPKRYECQTGGVDYRPPEEACDYIGPKVEWAAFGDSHAVELAYGLAKGLEPYGIGLRHLSFSGCVPAFGRVLAEDEPCSRWTAEAVAYLDHRTDISTVVISYRINASLFGGSEHVFPDQPDTVSPQDRELRWQSYVGLMAHFVGQGKRVILALQAPELPLGINRLLLGASPTDVGIRGVPRAWWDARSAYVTAHLRDIPPEVMVVDPTNLFCDSRECYAGKNGQSWYFDDDHLSVVGAEVVARKILELPMVAAALPQPSIKTARP